MALESPTFVQSLIAGGAAGLAVDLLFFPIDTIKTRVQSAQGFLRAGGLRGVYQGIGSVIVGSAPGAAAFFATYDTMKRHLPLSERLSPINHIISASVAETVACVIRVPTEVVKTRSQASIYGKGALSSLAAARRTFDIDGIRGFYRGFGITIFREIPFTSIQFPLYEILKISLVQRLDRETLYAHEAAVCGSTAGAVAAALTTPLDVFKTRIMLDVRNAPGRPAFRRHLTEMYTNERLSIFFSGLIPRTLWISAGGAVFLGVYEWVVHGLQKY